jgi:hypothetical protein
MKAFPSVDPVFKENQEFSPYIGFQDEVFLLLLSVRFHKVQG